MQFLHSEVKENVFDTLAQKRSRRVIRVFLEGHTVHIHITLS